MPRFPALSVFLLPFLFASAGTAEMVVDRHFSLARSILGWIKAARPSIPSGS